MRYQSAFSLTETLVAISIVLVLAALSFSGLGEVRRRSYEAACASNLRQAHLATMLYREAHDGGAADVGSLYAMGYPPDIVNPATLDPYVGHRALFTCPHPKRWAGVRFPDYEYALLLLSERDSGQYLAGVLDRYGSRIPLYRDLNHNDHAMVSVFAPRVRKRLLYINIGGSFVGKHVTSSFEESTGIDPYELSD